MTNDNEKKITEDSFKDCEDIDDLIKRNNQEKAFEDNVNEEVPILDEREKIRPIKLSKKILKKSSMHNVHERNRINNSKSKRKKRNKQARKSRKLNKMRNK